MKVCNCRLNNCNNTRTFEKGWWVYSVGISFISMECRSGNVSTRQCISCSQRSRHCKLCYRCWRSWALCWGPQCRLCEVRIAVVCHVTNDGLSNPFGCPCYKYFYNNLNMTQYLWLLLFMFYITVIDLYVYHLGFILLFIKHELLQLHTRTLSKWG
jgi:hypothetical protein